MKTTFGDRREYQCAAWFRLETQNYLYFPVISIFTEIYIQYKCTRQYYLNWNTIIETTGTDSVGPKSRTNEINGRSRWRVAIGINSSKRKVKPKKID